MITSGSRVNGPQNGVQAHSVSVHLQQTEDSRWTIRRLWLRLRGPRRQRMRQTMMLLWMLSWLVGIIAPGSNQSESLFISPTRHQCTMPVIKETELKCDMVLWNGFVLTVTGNCSRTILLVVLEKKWTEQFPLYTRTVLSSQCEWGIILPATHLQQAKSLETPELQPTLDCLSEGLKFYASVRLSAGSRADVLLIEHIATSSLASVAWKAIIHVSQVKWHSAWHAVTVPAMLIEKEKLCYNGKPLYGKYCYSLILKNIIVSGM